ncbi:MAG: phosphonate ABC transporter, permease protein PhnE [Candidatus Methylomirabilales bacterium]
MNPPSRPPAAPSFRESKTFLHWLFLAGLVVVFLWSARMAQVNPGTLLNEEALANFWRFFVGAFPPDLSADFLGLLVKPTIETVQISILGTAIAVAIGLPLGLLGTATLAYRGILHGREVAGSPARRVARFLPYAASRAVLSLFRSIPEFVWALMFVKAVGLGAFPGVLAIGVAYGGMIGKVYSEILEVVDPQPLEALQATGASRAQIVLYGFLPQAYPNFVSYTLYRWECAIRASAVLGLVGAGGLGQQIEISMRMFDFHQVFTLVMILFALVAGVDWLSARIRQRVFAR